MTDRPLRLNLGCGNERLAGFVNVDLLDGPAVDVVADVSRVLPFEDSAAEMIYASHVLEHLPHSAVPRVLCEWRRVLRDGGIILVAVPDLDAIARLLVTRPGWFTPPHEPWVGAIYGGQTTELDFHKTGFTLPWLTYLLSNAGFGSIQRVERFSEIGASDASWSPLPFGSNISLNVRAVAGGVPLPGELFKRSLLEYPFNAVDRALLVFLRASTRIRSTLMNRRRMRIERSVGSRRLDR
jgi:SAM-dependent methyltransferase